MDDSYGTLLSSVLIQKLPPELRLIIGGQVTEDWTLPSIMRILGEELEARERTATLHNERIQVPPLKGTMNTALLSGNKSDNKAVCH